MAATAPASTRDPLPRPSRDLTAASAKAEQATLTAAIGKLEQSIGLVIRGKERPIRLAVAALLARGHLLIEDIPGVGKTTLGRALARSVGGAFRRIQFTSDLLPSDIIGVNIYDAGDRKFEFKRGPLFANIVLADEINRTTPRTQSALLEAMSEGKVSVDDETYDLAQPFMVLATQNPSEQFGTYPLPESQLDRFLLRIQLGYPDRAIEREVLRERTNADPVARLEPALDLATVLSLQDAVEAVAVDERILDYAMNVVEETRRHPSIAVGVSTRGALAWFRVAQALALCEGRTYCVPDDFKQLAQPALAHRISLRGMYDGGGTQRAECARAIDDILARVVVPT
ncbi:MAG: MoxR family ATPase [Myxococcales bacterium]|nr:MoxR family ATPase [Myxococcales bacterium]